MFTAGKRSAAPWGGQPGHRGTYRALLPVEPVDEVVAVVPEVCRHCGQPFPESAGRLWHWFRAGEFDRKALQRRLIPLQARLGRLLRHGQENADRKAAGLCRELTKWWRALWTFARVEGVEPTNNGAEWALRPAVLWRKGSFGSDSEAGSRLAERLLTVVATCRQQGRHLLDFLVAAGQAALEGAAPPSLLSAQQGG